MGKTDLYFKSPEILALKKKILFPNERFFGFCFVFGGFGGVFFKSSEVKRSEPYMHAFLWILGMRVVFAKSVSFEVLNSLVLSHIDKI